MNSSESFERILPGERATDLLGDDLAIALKPGDAVALHGDLGAGKTTLARAVIRAIAAEPGLEVPSPTFTLVQSYALRIPLHHFDLYRLAGPEEMEELGLQEARAEGVALVEWPERAAEAFADAIHVHLQEHGEGRRAEIAATGEAAMRIARTLAIREFLEAAGHGAARRAFLLGDASVRAYEVVTTEGGERLILMDAPARHDEPILRDGLPYSRIARLAQSVHAFVGVANALREAGFSAPRIHAQDLDQGLLLLEHLGEEHFLGKGGKPVAERYEAAARLLAALHERSWPRSLPVAEGIEHTPPPYDHDALAIETELLLDWYLPHMRGREATDEEREEFRTIWEGLFTRLDKSEQSLVLRDYHSPNIIWRGRESGLARLGLVDVQDAVFGPAAYDVASLVLDARATISGEMETALLDAYCGARRAKDFERADFEEAYAIAAAQRNTKLLGIFVRLARRDGKPSYLQHLPRIRGYMKRLLRRPVLAGLKGFYERHGLLEGETE